MHRLMQDISFKKTDGKLKEMFGKKAEEIAEKLDGDIKTTQYRKFYDKILELNEKAQNLTSKEFEIEVLPFVKMINSKVAYSKTRKHCGVNYVTLMDESIKKVNSAKELQNFKYFLEAIIGYMPKN